MDKLLYKPSELVDVLGISRSMIYLLIQQGEIPHITIGTRGIRCPAEGVRQWIDKKSSHQYSEKEVEG